MFEYRTQASRAPTASNGCELVHDTLVLEVYPYDPATGRVASTPFLRQVGPTPQTVAAVSPWEDAMQRAEVYEPAYGDCGDPAGRSCYLGDRRASGELGQLMQATRPGIREVSLLPTRSALLRCSGL
jgi:hypothetical protein